MTNENPTVSMKTLDVNREANLIRGTTASTIFSLQKTHFQFRYK